MMRKLLGNPAIQFLIGRTIGLYMLFVGATTRWTRINQAAVEPFWRRGGPTMVACIWHGRFPLIHKMWRFGPSYTPAKMLISRSREGGIVAHTSRTVGAEAIRGSAPKSRYSKGGLEAMRAMVRHIEDGGIVGMTPDGPKGPRMRAKKAPVQLAKLVQSPLLAVTWATSHRLVFGKSWDHFVLPLPFGRGALIWGNLIDPPNPDAGDAEIEAVRAQLETELNRISAEADRIAGVKLIEPAPLKRESPPEAQAVAAQ